MSTSAVAVRAVRLGAVLGCVAVVAAGCTGSDTAGPAPSSAASSAAQTPTATPTVGPECKPGPDRDVQELPDVVIPAVHIPAVSVAREHVGNAVAEPIDVAAVDLAPALVDAGCIIRYHAPAGCLGAIEITSVSVPAVTMPGYTFTDDAGRVSEIPAKTAPAVTVPAAKIEQVCQQTPKKGDQYIGSVHRDGLHRPVATRPAVYRDESYRAAICDGDKCTKDALVPDATIPEVSVPEVFVEDAYLKEFFIPGGGVLKGDDSNAYFTPTDVLFDIDSATLKPGSTQVLTAIVADIDKSGYTGPIRVEGHTDDTGSAEHNLQLSEQRAQSVANWLVDQGKLDRARITVTGYGETAPAQPNDSAAHRQANRRVVIAVDKQQ